ncbi:MAG TPA: SHOCT domain-containing protein [Methermicoccus shengliensis]|uniref:SHOCT domain-containing protein n=2 Tax=Methermicoccus shengliensis TaxID=660064 RepID=A0A832VMC2_9EURY|nr:SHOCT domain-containing protein [Methermicoccus shengliensis]
MMWPWMAGFGWAGMGGGLIVLLILVVLVVWVLNREEESNEGRGGGTSSAREILDERYARGEISEEEYLRMRERLER